MIVGIAGIGRMGAIFAERLLDHGLLLHVWNRTESKCAPLARRGANVCASPNDLAEKCDVILLSMADESASGAVLSGADGVAAAPLNGKIIVETSTLGPTFIRSMAKAVTAQSGDFIDAPVLGTIGPAREGQLVALAGGTPAATAKIAPVLDVLCRKVIHVGPVGAGATMKLVVNMHLATYWHSLAETLVMGTRSGLDLKAILDILSESPIATSSLAGKLPNILGETSDVGFDIDGVYKDLCIATSLAEEVGVHARTAASARAGFSAAAQKGWGSKDVAEIIDAVRDMSQNDFNDQE